VQRVCAGGQEGTGTRADQLQAANAQRQLREGHCFGRSAAASAAGGLCLSSALPAASEGGHWFGGHHLGPSTPMAERPPQQAAGRRQCQGRGDHPPAPRPAFDSARKAETRLVLPSINLRSLLQLDEEILTGEGTTVWCENEKHHLKW